MTMTDPVSDLLTRIRNASAAMHESVDIPFSKLKLGIVKALQEEGYVSGYKQMDEGVQGKIRVGLKYTPDNKRVISHISRGSRPGRRYYVGAEGVVKIKSGLGISILTTSKGILTDRQARRERVGGEVLCYVW